VALAIPARRDSWCEAAAVAGPHVRAADRAQRRRHRTAHRLVPIALLPIATQPCGRVSRGTTRGGGAVPGVWSLKPFLTFGTLSVSSSNQVNRRTTSDAVAEADKLTWTES
jgi:hypothetical protein